MAIKQIRLRVDDLVLGMYVSRLDRAWSQTPFPLQGFHIRSPQDITNLKAYCDYVFIDINKGRAPVGSSSAGRGKMKARKKPVYQSVEKPLVGLPNRLSKRAKDVPQAKPAPLTVYKGTYETTVELKEEARRAKTVVEHLKGDLSVVGRQLLRGKTVDYRRLSDSAEAMVDSVLRCPDAFTWLVRLRASDQHSYDHSLRAALWAVQFARFVGLPRDEINLLCQGTLLKDVGKSKLSNRLLRKVNKSAEEESEYRRYVNYGVEMLRSTRQVGPRVIAIVRYHAERHDGSGFPEGVSGGRIPLLARIAGISSTYDEICMPRGSAQPLSPSQAVGVLYEMRDKAFTDDLVVSFIQSIGLYPAGTLVELTSGDIGVVVEQDPKSRLLPKVAVLGRDAGDTDFGSSVTLIDLKDEAKTRKILLKKNTGEYRDTDRVVIARDLQPGGYDIDLRGISELVMKQTLDEKSGFFSGFLK